MAHFLYTDAVLAGQAAAQFDTRAQNLLSGVHHAPGLVRVALVVHQDGMDVAVAGVKDVGDAQLVFLRHVGDALQNIRHLGARNHPVLRAVVGRQTADGAECAFAALPDRLALGVVARGTHLAGMVLAADFLNLLGLRVETRGRPVDFDNQNRAGVGRKSDVKGGFDRLDDERVHHLQRGRHDPGRDDVRYGLCRPMDGLEHGQKGA